MFCAGSDGGKEKSFLDDDVCRPFLLGICINELFVNTVNTVLSRVELGNVGFL